MTGLLCEVINFALKELVPGRGSYQSSASSRSGVSPPCLSFPAATAALRRKKQFEQELDRLSGTRLTLETQVRYFFQSTTWLTLALPG